MKRVYDVIVVGAGYIGASVAYNLTKAGLSTLLLEQGEVAAGASRANYGNIQIQDAELDFSLPMIMKGLTYFDHLEEELGYSIQYKKMGSLLAIENESQWNTMQKRLQILRQNGIQAELISGDHLQEIEPLLDAGRLMGALYHEHEGQIYPFALIWAFLHRALEQGLTMKLHTRMTGILHNGSKISGIATTKGNYEAPIVVLTTGAWTQQIGKMLGRDWIIPFVRGQAVVTEAFPPLLRSHISSAAFFEHSLESDGIEEGAQENEVTETDNVTLAMAQSVHGNLLVGEVSKMVDHYDTHTTPDAPTALAEVLSKYYPKLSNTRILRGWASPVAFTNDSRPYLGKVDGLEGLILATAFRSTVIVTPLAGEVVTQLVLDGQCDLDISNFSPDRKA